MPHRGIGASMFWCWYLVIVTIDLIQAQSPFDGVGFLADPFLELTAGVTTPANQKSSKLEPSCVSNGALAGAIIGTLLLSVFIAFLTWMVYLRQKLQELHLYENQEKKHMQISPQHHHRTVPSSLTAKSKQQCKKQHKNEDVSDHNGNQLPLDVTDYKFGTFPFRQSQTPSVNRHYNHTDWLTRIPTSFHSMTLGQNTQMIDIELLDPTFCGLNFSITGNMRAGIFVKEILDKGASAGKIKLNSSDQLRAGDRIVALTVCFESIVYEDALTILSYASPYPVVLRVQRPLHSTKVNEITETRPTTNKVKWRDDFELYDNDTTHSRSVPQPNSSTTVSTDTKLIPTTTPHRSSSKKIRSNPRPNNKSSSTSKGNKIKTISNTVLATVGSTAKRSSTDKKKHPDKAAHQTIIMSTGLTAKPAAKIVTPPMTKNKTTMKSVTNKVISYLHYRGANGGHVTDATNNSEATIMPYYDSPYDYYYGAHISQSQLNKNNNNSLSTESLTAVTSLYTIQLASTKSNLPTQQPIIPRPCERRLSSPAIMTPLTIEIHNDKDTLLKNIDTFV